MRRFDPFHLWLFIGCVALLALSVVAVSAGLSIGGALLIVAASPLVIVVGYETVGHRHQSGPRWRVNSRSRRHPLVCYRDRMSSNPTTWWPAR